MSVLHALLLGALQGAAEFLPISSSAHLILLPWFFGWPDQGLSFDIALHVGTLAALLVYFARDWHAILRGAALGTGRERKVLAALLIALIPGAIAGVLLEDIVQNSFRAPLLIAGTLAFGGILLGLADARGRRVKGRNDVTLRDAFLAGLAQAVALIPGISRSGATMTALRALGYERSDAARLSFLLAAPITAGAALYGLRDLGLSDIDGPFLLGLLASFAVGMASIHWLLRFVSRRDYKPFVWYRVVLAALVILVFVIRRF